MAFPRIGAKSMVSAHHHGKTLLALDGAPLLEPPPKNGIVGDMDPRKFRRKQTGKIAEIVVCMGWTEEDDTAVWFRYQRDTVNRYGKRFEFHPESTVLPLQSNTIESLYCPSEMVIKWQYIRYVSKLLSLASSNNHLRT